MPSTRLGWMAERAGGVGCLKYAHSTKLQVSTTFWCVLNFTRSPPHNSAQLCKGAPPTHQAPLHSPIQKTTAPIIEKLDPYRSTLRTNYLGFDQISKWPPCESCEDGGQQYKQTTSNKISLALGNLCFSVNN